ncbi:hypothetical protein K402DRAFT_396086 [Aulographum hederae CBS 113979]|uniref:Integral membrane protein S linking to the trans Golgi network-domain-containing protein n=1 Tax=Aulographum hederae CBS 113979 TaxID=1176131 RepID=A0A6G1GT96_9PEZI|nr:hypothetical protein K402DRAFT_396086 [Aulographum hederae CBS 113979]
MPRRRRPPRPGALAGLAPLRILTQIAVLQIAYYACAAILILFTALVAGKDVRLDLLLSWRSLRGDVTVGWMLGLVWMLNSLICVIFLMLLVARSKLIPDFALTIHFLHLLVTSFYSRSIPSYWFWWALQIASAALMTFLGVWSCQWRELRPIKFGGTASSPRKAAGAAGDLESGPVDNGVGVGRGSRRGRGKDGAGQYEMVGMTDQDERV